MYSVDLTNIIHGEDPFGCEPRPPVTQMMLRLCIIDGGAVAGQWFLRWDVTRSDNHRLGQLQLYAEYTLQECGGIKNKA